jgi:thiamine pyrophosphate-dependent acetolactate synthase large subunit-like protein
MHVGGSKGSISGNYAAAEAELLIVIGSRAVCQADCSGIGYKKAQHVININGDLGDATHYNRTLALVGDISAIADRLAGKLEASKAAANKADWLAACAAKKAEWSAYKRARFEAAPIRDEVERVNRREDVGKPDDAIERSAELVAHRGQEVALQAVEFVELEVRLSELIDLAVEVDVDVPKLILRGD